MPVPQNFYRRLLQLPLFQGFSEADYLEMAAKVRLNFQTLQAGKTIIRQGSPCKSYIFIVGGDFCVTHHNDSPFYMLHEWFSMPALLGAENLYGLRQRYAYSATTKSVVTLFEVSKDMVFNVLMNYEVFRMNYMNLLSYYSQTRRDKLWLSHPSLLQERFAAFLSYRCLRPAGHKRLHIRQTSLAAELLATLRNVSLMLQNLEERQLLHHGRGFIDVPRFEKLVQEV
ncbi:MAG: Crp/Fnr family transcriptional regulator [Bacteroidaceae bacterium]|nr:Crp/Fnr family transcriptional regulator [Bacteroidaceae bacterium]